MSVTCPAAVVECCTLMQWRLRWLQYCMAVETAHSTALDDKISFECVLAGCNIYHVVPCRSTLPNRCMVPFFLSLFSLFVRRGFVKPVRSSVTVKSSVTG